MTLATVKDYYATDTEDAIDKIKDTLVSAGWTLHDDQSAGSPYAYIMSSTGEDADEATCYCRIWQGTNLIYVALYGYWNNSTHAGTFIIGSTSYTRAGADDDAQFYISVAATKDGFAFVTQVGTTYRMIKCGIFTPLFHDKSKGFSTGAISSGSSVVITLGTDEADTFVVGRTYQIFDGTSREQFECTAVTPGSDQITADSLTYSYGSGAVVGIYPYRWYTWADQFNYVYTLPMDSEGTGAVTQDRAPTDMFHYSYVDPTYHGYIMYPHIINASDTVPTVAGIEKAGLPYLKSYVAASSGHTVSVGDHDSGTSSGSNGTTTLNDTSKSWSTDEWNNKIVIITGGTGAGQFRTISDTTSTQLTISSAWDTTPDGTSTYTIADEGWLYKYVGAAYTLSHALRMI